MLLKMFISLFCLVFLLFGFVTVSSYSHAGVRCTRQGAQPKPVGGEDGRRRRQGVNPVADEREEEKGKSREERR